MNDYAYFKVVSEEGTQWCRTNLRYCCIYKVDADYFNTLSHTNRIQILTPVEVLTLFPHIEAIPLLEQGKRPPMHWVGSDK